MTVSNKLPPDFFWQQDHDQHTLFLDTVALARVAPVGLGWRVDTLLEVPGIPLQQVAVRHADYGKSWATRWVLQRQRAVAAACGRLDLVPPVAPTPPRRIYAWQAPSWARVTG